MNFKGEILRGPFFKILYDKDPQQHTEGKAVFKGTGRL